MKIFRIILLLTLISGINALQAKTTIFAILNYNGILSYDHYILNENEVIKYKHFQSGAIFEGSLHKIEDDSCKIFVKQLLKNQIPFGGNIGFSKIYTILHQFNFTLKKGIPQRIPFGENNYLELTLVE